ncbi:MAG: hypothetical protein O7D86_02610 [Proteobacteria bacterium]|nr:hypothetical protein [Pseudomonadota bacterium]
MAATERVPVLMTPGEKKRIVEKAKKAGISTSEYVRRAAESYHPTEDEQALIAMIEQMNQATHRTGKVIDKTLAYVKASNKRIAQMEAKVNEKAA